MTFYTLWLEWDFGQGDIIFRSKSHAIEWLIENNIPQETDFANVEELLESGLASFGEVTVWRP